MLHNFFWRQQKASSTHTNTTRTDLNVRGLDIKIDTAIFGLVDILKSQPAVIVKKKQIDQPAYF